MLFNSFQFVVFYLIVVAVFFVLPHRSRWAFLLAASYYFYMCWNPVYIVVIWAITLIDYVAGMRIEDSTTKRSKKLWLSISLMGNFGLLIGFKYSGFMLASFQNVLGLLNTPVDVPRISWILPVGLSFHTFQAVSYTIEVYRGRFRAERHLGIYGLYVAFFPQMVAGPIERPQHLLAQFRERKALEYVRLRSGLELILWGLYKKMIVADSLAVLVNRVFDRPQGFSGGLLLIATAAFTIQLYCDFSGYSDMAVGLARILGYDLMINFRYPHFAKSIGEFWRRWHISLSSWFRDYVYLPLGGSQTSKTRWVGNIMTVFLLSGLWHGANWTFVLWGGMHGIYLIAGRALSRPRRWLSELSGVARFPALQNALAVMSTSALVAFALVLFRAKSLTDAAYIWTHMLQPGRFGLLDLLEGGLPLFELQIAALAIVVLFAVEILQAYNSTWFDRVWERRSIRWPAYCACCYSIVFFGVFDRLEFIYFQF